MYVFAIAALFGLGIMALAGGIDRLVPKARDYRAVTLVVFGVLGAWLTDFDMWEHFRVAVREEWIGIVITGLALGGLAHMWHEVLGVFSGVVRKTNDEAAALEANQGLKAA